MKKLLAFCLAVMLLLTACSATPPASLINQTPETMFSTFKNPTYKVTALNDSEIDIQTDDSKPGRIIVKFTVSDHNQDKISIVYDTLERNEVYLARDVIRGGEIVERHYAFVESLAEENKTSGSSGRTRKKRIFDVNTKDRSIEDIGSYIQEIIISSYAQLKSYYQYKDDPTAGWQSDGFAQKKQFVLSSGDFISTGRDVKLYALYTDETLQEIKLWTIKYNSFVVDAFSNPTALTVPNASDYKTKTVEEILNGAITLKDVIGWVKSDLRAFGYEYDN